MTRDPVTASVPGTREQILEKMHAETVSCVPIVERESGKLVGIVTRSDLLLGIEEDQIALIMTREPVTARAEETIDEAVKRLVKEGVRRLPVVDDGKPVGMLSVADLVKEVDSDEEIQEYYTPRASGFWDRTPVRVAAVSMQLSQDDASIALDSDGNPSGILSETDLVRSARIDEYVKRDNLGSGEEDDDWTWEGFKDNITIYHGVSKIDFPDVPISEIMTKDVVTKYSKTTAREASTEMVERGIEQIPVVNEDDEVVGILRDQDLIPLLL